MIKDKPERCDDQYRAEASDDLHQGVFCLSPIMISERHKSCLNPVNVLRARRSGEGLQQQLRQRIHQLP